MNITTNLPSYEELFGALDFKKGDEARSVYSPAAYLADLIQLIEDEFIIEENPIYQRRVDIKSILLNNENTFTLTPYLDIVNEILESKVSGDVYSELKKIKYPFKLPFNLDNEKVKQSLKLLNITPDQLYKLFADRRLLKQETVARVHLGLSEEEWDVILHKSNGAALKKLYGGIKKWSDLQNVEMFLETTEISGAELRTLLYQKLSTKEQEAGLAHRFFINHGLNGFAVLDAKEENITWSGGASIPEAWYERVHRFIRLAKKTEVDFESLDLILRSCCDNNLDAEAIKKIAVITNLASKYELEIPRVCALFGSINTLGHGNYDKPVDLFNSVFNAKYTPADSYFLLGDEIIPEQYYGNGFHELQYTGDVLSDQNKAFRKRLEKALHISEKNISLVVEKFEKKELNEELWRNPEYKLQLLSTLFKISQLTEFFGISYEALFCLFDILEKDPTVRSYSNFDMLIDYASKERSCYKIITEGDVSENMWLVQLLGAIVEWMHSNDFEAETLKSIVEGEHKKEETEEAEDTKEKEEQDQIRFFNDLYQQFKEVAVTPKDFEGEGFEKRASQVIHRLLQQKGSPLTSTFDNRLVRFHEEKARLFAYQAIDELYSIDKEDFKGLGLEEKLTDKIFSNLVFKGYLSAKGMLKMEKFPETADAFKVETDFSAYKESIFQIIHNLYVEEVKASSGYMEDEYSDYTTDEYPAKEYGSDSYEADEYETKMYEGNGYEDSYATKEEKHAVVDFQVFPSDFESLALSETELNELYDNLIFNGYIDEEGNVLKAHFCMSTKKLASFEVNVGLEKHADAVFEVIYKRVSSFDKDNLFVDQQVFAGLEFTATELEDLIENLKFNEYLYADGRVWNKSSLLTLKVKDFDLALQFYPHRRKILDALQQHIKVFKESYCQIGKDLLRGVADEIAACRVYKCVEEKYLDDSYIKEDKEAFFKDSSNASSFDPGYSFDTTEASAIFTTINSILTTSEKYYFSIDPLLEMDFDDSETDELLEILLRKECLDMQAMVPYEKLEYFLNIDNALKFSVEFFEDYSKDVFFVLHAMAKETDAAITEITEKLETLAVNQETALLSALKDKLEVDTGVVKILLQKVFRAPEYIVETFMHSVLEVVNLQDKITKIPCNGIFNVAFRRVQQFAKLANQLKLNREEVEVIFRDQDLVDKFPEELTLPEGVDQFNTLLEGSDGVIYVFVNSTYYMYHAKTYELLSLDTEEEDITDFIEDREYLKELLEKPNTIQSLLNTTENIKKVEASFTDLSGNAIIIANGEYYRREKGSYWWQKKDREWGKLESNFDVPERIDAAFQDEAGKTYLFSGDQYIRYSEGYEAIDRGYPKKIEENWKNEGFNEKLPIAFQTAIDASFQDKNGKTHLFKDGQYVSSDDLNSALPIRNLWGKVKNNFEGAEKIDAAYTKGYNTYLFSGDQVVAYHDSLENEKVYVQEGYPKTIASHLPNLPADFQISIDAAFVGEDGNLHLFKDDEALIYDLENGAVTTKKTKKSWGLVKNNILNNSKVDAAFVGLDGNTYLFSGDQYVRYSGDNYEQVDEGYPRIISEDWEGLTKVDAAFVLDGKTYLYEKVDNDQQKYVRYSTKDYSVPDEDYPMDSADNWLNLPYNLVEEGYQFANIDAVFNDKSGKTYLFKGDKFVMYENNHRWWSEPEQINTKWDSIPFESVDAAFTGTDGKTYIFAGDQYIRYSSENYSKVDDRYPSNIKSYWGNIKNNIYETGKVDAALVVESREEIDGVDEINKHTYLFSGNQFFRYRGDQYNEAEAGYPKYIHTSLKEEPRFKELTKVFDSGIDAAFADYRNVYLFKDKSYHVVADTPDHTYENLGFNKVDCAFVEEGTLYLEEENQWNRYSSIEGNTGWKKSALPNVLQEVPNDFKKGIDAVLMGTDKNTYIFKDHEVLNVSLDRIYPLHEEWGRIRNNVDTKETIDAVFLGTDGKTYLFSGDQFISYEKGVENYSEAKVEELPLSIKDHWGGLTNVAVAYVKEEVTYLFEKPDEYGQFRYVRYSGSDYSQPDEGYPKNDDFSYWKIPERYQEEGFDTIDTVFVEGDNVFFIQGESYLQYNIEDEVWAYPRPIERIWRNISLEHDDFKRINAVFFRTDKEGYFFSENHYVYYSDGMFSEPMPINETWGFTENNFVSNPSGNRVDAAFVWENEVTYLFSGNQYIRYSSSDYRYVDQGYPKEISKYLREEEAFRYLPDSFEDAIQAQEAKGASVYVDAVVASENSIFVFIDSNCHAASMEAEYTSSWQHLGKVKNRIQKENQVDAALVNGQGQVFLFSGEQYVRYSEENYQYVDDGYPKTIATSLAQEEGMTDIPNMFHYGLDAALKGKDGTYYLFKDEYYYSTNQQQVLPVEDTWGKTGNAFIKNPADKTIDAAFMAADGKLYVFKGEQYIRYCDLEQEYVDEGYPLSIKDEWGDMPVEFEKAVDSAFVFKGKTYFVKGEEYIRYSDSSYQYMDGIYPQKFAYRWGEWNDFLLNDLKIITRYKHLQDTYRGENHSLTDLLHIGEGNVKEPYKAVADIFGWDVDEVKWLKRHNAFITTDRPFETKFDLELILKMYDVLYLTGKAGVDPAVLYTDVWKNLYSEKKNQKEAAEVLYTALATGNSEKDWEILSKQLQTGIGQARRDALVSYVIHQDGTTKNPRELYEKLLIDVQMSGCFNTSRIKEAIAAVQLYLHRYFFNLEQADLKGEEDEITRQKLKERWKWLKSYRIWEANRKVFLYPENYIRPELRDTKTPAFQTFEDDLLQADVTDPAVEKAYKKYLDEFTEVSALKIAGGYVYDEPGSFSEVKKLILFGRTQSEPNRYYYRLARFPNGAPVWEPWLPVNVQIKATKVYPVFAFGRIFVFWTSVETITPDVEEAELTIKVDEDIQAVTNNQTSKYNIRIHYSFYDLNKEWGQIQTLDKKIENIRRPFDVELFVENSENLNLSDKEMKHEHIVINCGFHQFEFKEPSHEAFILTSELYSEKVRKPKKQNKGKDIFESLFEEGVVIDDDKVTMLSSTEKTSEAPWFSFDHKGGSFLCKPAIPTLSDKAWPLSLNDSILFQDWKQIDAAFQGPDGNHYFFNNDKRVFIVTESFNEGSSIWLRHLHNYMQNKKWADATYFDNGTLYLFRGDRYVTCTEGEGFSTEEHELSTFNEIIPKGWDRIDATFKGPDGKSYFFNNHKGQYITSDGTIADIKQAWSSLGDVGSRINKPTLHLTFKSIVDGQIQDEKGKLYPLFGNPEVVADNVFGNVLSLDGNGDYSELSGDDIPTGNQISICFWSYAGDKTPKSSSVIYGLGGNNRRALNIHLPWGDERIYFDCGNTGSYDRIAKRIDIEDIEERWVHWTFTKDVDAGIMKIYKNGILWHSEEGKHKPLIPIKSLKLGVHNNNDFHQGKLAHLRVYDHTLSLDEVKQIIVRDQSKVNIDAAFSLGNKTFIFSGNEYVRYSGSEYKLDKGYPKVIKGNPDNLPNWNNVDAAFLGVDDEAYFLNNDKQGVFVTSEPKEIPIRSRWGFDTVDAAYYQDGKYYLISQNKFSRYSVANDQISDKPDSGYPKSFKMPGLNKVRAAFTIDFKGEYRTYLVGDDVTLRYTRSETKLFDNVKHLEGGSFGYILKDLGLNNFLSIILSLPYFKLRAAYYNPQINTIVVVFDLRSRNGKYPVYAYDLTKKRFYRLKNNYTSRTFSYLNDNNQLQKSDNYDAVFKAEFKGKKLFYAFKGDRFVEMNHVPDSYRGIKWENSKEIGDKWSVNKVDAAFSLNDKVHLWSRDSYFSLVNQQEPDIDLDFKYIQGNWGNIPYELRLSGFDSSLNTGEKLYLFKGKHYVEYDLTDRHAAVPYEIEEVPFEIIRLTTSTTKKLNQKLFAGGIPALLSLSAQEENEEPAFSRIESTPTTIKVTDKVTTMPVSSHLDFFGANGLYYWEMFFHAPFLIAQTFNTEQKFEEAKTWYEYVYDPTETKSYWKFLPFLGVDIKALVRAIEAQILEHSLDASTIILRYGSSKLRYGSSKGLIDFTPSRSMTDLLDLLKSISTSSEQLAEEKVQQLKNLKLVTKKQPDALKELIGLVGQLPVRYLSENHNAQIEAYLNDPFDPHAIANLRYVAYQKSVVMSYIDNLTDWGDMHFRQYTIERIDEARMLYQLAYNLLGKRPENLGKRILSDDVTLEDLENSADYDFLLEIEDGIEAGSKAAPVLVQNVESSEKIKVSPAISVSGSSELTSFQGTLPVLIASGSIAKSDAVQVHDSVANPYFFVPENSAFVEYWNRVEDRLHKIRQCLNIDGEKQPLQLFQPPVDPMAVVQAIGSGASAGAALNPNSVAVPHYRFNVMVMKAHDLLFTLTRFGGELLGALEKKDAEALGTLHSKQEGVILNMTREIKVKQLEEVEESLKALRASEKNAKDRKKHYEQLLEKGMLPLEKGQLAMMSLGAITQGIAAGLNLGSAFTSAAPDVLAGPFIMGVKYGGSNIGSSLSAGAQASEVLGESLSMAGETMGVKAQHIRMEEDWEIQKKIAEHDEIEIEAQIESAKKRKEAAQKEIAVHDKQQEHHEEVSQFMIDKFSNEELYRWYSSKLSGVYNQMYQLTYDIAKQAEKAFQFERGLKEREVNYIQPAYWDNLKKGLLAGESLSLDVNRMEKAYMDNNSYDLEITKNISLLELDPVAFLQLKNKGVCEFALHEAHFDYDFPGHYCRQVKTIAITFDMAGGESVMATLTQLNHKTVLDPDAKAVKYLLDPKGKQPQGIRSDWRTNQQVALSHHDEFEKNNGLFELRFDSERYLPFEGTGAVSTWRLELKGKKGSYNLNNLLEVSINLKYTAKQGGDLFANAVKSILKPYQAVRFFDMHFDFPEAWNDFVSSDSDELVLPVSQDLFTNMRGNKIAGIFTKYDLIEEGSLSVIIDLGSELALPDAKFVDTTGLSVSKQGDEWLLRIKGDKLNLRNIQLAVSYTADV